MKNIIVISSSPRKNGNSNALVAAFVRGAEERGNAVEVISLTGKHMEFCRGCMVCNKTNRCVIADDMKQINEKLGKAEVVVFATPVYYYSVSGQLKTFFDRTSPHFTADYKFRDVYLLATAAEDETTTPEGTIQATVGWVDCFEKARLKKTVFAGGVDAIGDIAGHPALEEAYQTGKSIC